MMRLSKQDIGSISKEKGISMPAESYFSLPEKVLQFGTGVLLRGLPDYFIDKANKQGIFNGRVVVVKSTSNGGTDAFSEQDGLFTLCVRGLENGQRVEELIVNASISRVLSASDDWAAILECAANPELSVITSNTTEVGIVLVDDDIHAAPPVSFPGKLLSFLYRRYQIFNGAADKGFAIVPTELISDNGKKLKEIVLEQARRHNLGEGFIDWLYSANDFCNTLVDRIVPGKLSAADSQATEARLGYSDGLMIMSEVYRLWAIETTNPATIQKLSFSQADEGVVLAPNISKFKELKLRLLNGSHTFTCGLALLRGFATVKEAMADASFLQFIKALATDEIIPAILSEDITKEEASKFAGSVLDRFSNPYLEHQWLAITAQYTLKIKGRCLQIAKWYVEKFGVVPQHIATGFAAYLLFMRSVEKAGKYIGTINGKEYTITDQFAPALSEKWKNNTGLALVRSVLADEGIWDEPLTAIAGFDEAVFEAMKKLETI